MRLTGIPISLFSKINLSQYISVLHHMHAKSICNWMIRNKTKHRIVPCHPKLCCKFTTQHSCLYLYMLTRLTEVPVLLLSKINLSKSFSILHHINAKSICKWMTTTKTKHRMVPFNPKLCGMLPCQLLFLYLYMSMRLTRVLVSLFTKINLNKSFCILHGMHAKSIWTKHSMVPCHPKLCGKLTAQLSCLNLYMLMRLTGVPVSIFSKLNFSKSFFISALHACQVYTQVNENKQNKSQHGALPPKTLWQTHRSTLMPLPVYFHETDMGSWFLLLKNKSQQILFHPVPNACQIYMQVNDKRQKTHSMVPCHQKRFLINSPLNYCASTCISQRD